MPVIERHDGYEITPSHWNNAMMAVLWSVIYGLFVALVFVFDLRDRVEANDAVLMFAVIGGGLLAIAMIGYAILERRRPSRFLVTNDGVAIISRWRQASLSWSDIDAITIFRGAAIFRDGPPRLLDAPAKRGRIVIPYRSAGISTEDFRRMTLSVRPDAPVGRPVRPF